MKFKIRQVMKGLCEANSKINKYFCKIKKYNMYNSTHNCRQHGLVCTMG